MTGLVIFVVAAFVAALGVSAVWPAPPPIRVEAIYAEYVLNQMKREGLIK